MNLKYNEKTGEFEEISSTPPPFVQKTSSNSSSCLIGVFVSLLLICGIAFSFFILGNTTKENTEVVSSCSYNLYGYVGQYPVTMQIQISGSAISGSYYYDSQGPNKRLILSGSNNNGEIHLIENTTEGMHTGDFRGKLFNGEFTGNFINYQGKEMAFSLVSR